MTTFVNTRVPRLMVLRPTTAGEMMTPQPLSFDGHTPIHKASALLTHHRLEAAPVVDRGGRPIGMVTASACASWEEFTRRSGPNTCDVARADWTPVSEIANPNIALVRVGEFSDEVIKALVKSRVRRVYVIDETEKLVGVVSSSDALRQLVESGANW